MIKYSLNVVDECGTCKYENEQVSFTAKEDSNNARWSFEVLFEQWEEDAYVFSPSCLYNGNQFPKLDRGWYAPMYKNDEMGANAKPYINNVPALNEDGSGLVEVTTGDMATPCLAVFFRHCKKATFVFFEQAVKGRNIGAKVQKQKFTLEYPSDRSKQYRMRESKSEYSGECTIAFEGKEVGVSVKKGEKICSRVKIEQIDCENMSQFMAFFFENRNALLSSERATTNYNDSLYKTMKNHFNLAHWSGEFYGAMGKVWQSGWVSGVMSAYALAKLGNRKDKLRAKKTVQFLIEHQAPTGFFYSRVCNGKIESDARYASTKEEYKNMLGAHLVRRSGDALFFLLKIFEILNPKKDWENSAKKCADAFVDLFDKHKTFGQYINIETADMLVNCSACGANVVGALVKAWNYFKDDRYLQTAISAGEYYYNKFVQNGYTYGGAGDAVCAPDSESSYGMLESFVSLYEATKQDKYLTYAKDSANLFSTWVFSYKYDWVVDCEFKKQNVNTVGSVFANVQNKHFAPGICTSSGDALFRLYKYSGEKAYLELLKDIVYFIPQCVSTKEKPLYAYNYPHGDERGRLEYGCICERVNTSDWEDEKWIGNVWNGSCWCEISLILTFADLMSYEEMKN